MKKLNKTKPEFNKLMKDGFIMGIEGKYYVRGFPDIEVLVEDNNSSNECKIYSMESGDRPRDEQNCLVWNTKYGDVPLMAYWSGDDQEFIPLHVYIAFPLVITHWMEIPDFDPDK